MDLNPTDLGNGIFCLDTGYVRPGLAACYLMHQGGQWAIIETGTSNTVPLVLDYLAAEGIAADRINYVMPTHIHLDHAGGAGLLMEKLPSAQLVVHPRGADHMANPERLISASREVYGIDRFDTLYGEIRPIAPERILVAEDDMTLNLGGRVLRIRHGPGHAEHHYCIWDSATEGWFTGDNFGISYREMIGDNDRHLMPSTTPAQFNPEKLLATLDMLMSYRPARIYLTHFGVLTQPEEQVEKLRTAIGEYCDIALNHECDRDRIAVIREALTAREFGLLQLVRPTLSAIEAQTILGLDLSLNAQGLDAWLEKRKRYNYAGHR